MIIYVLLGLMIATAWGAGVAGAFLGLRWHRLAGWGWKFQVAQCAFILLLWWTMPLFWWTFSAADYLQKASDSRAYKRAREQTARDLGRG